jgi:hypothetical protein
MSDICDKNAGAVVYLTCTYLPWFLEAYDNKEDGVLFQVLAEMVLHN